jgi:hypothetical protein
MYIQIICPIFCLQKANNSLLFTIVFSKDARWYDQLVAAVLSFPTALASIQLLAKHRTSEKQTAIRAAQLEVKRTPIIQWPEPTERKAPEKHRRSFAKPMRHDGRRSIPRRKVGIFAIIQGSPGRSCCPACFAILYSDQYRNRV